MGRIVLSIRPVLRKTLPALLILCVLVSACDAGVELLAELAQPSSTATTKPVALTPTARPATREQTPAPAPTPVSAPTTVAPSATAASVPSAAGSVITQDPNAVVRVAERVRPAVVSITALQISIDQYSRPVPEEAGVGSGVIYDPSGLIITNHHVVEGADQVRVSLPDGRTFPGKIVGSDTQTDLAVVKIDGANLPVAELGDSSLLRVGEWVVAIGNALDLDGGPTVTVGVVGALDRYISENGNTIFDLIQTDAAINPGNSGGPLVNLAGQVIGINVAIARAPGAGIGFAISITGARPIITELATKGKVTRPWLGVSLVSVSGALAEARGLPAREGALVTQIVRTGPLARAGGRPGDVIVQIDDAPVQNVVTLLKAMSRHKVGDTIKVVVARQGGQQTLSVALEAMPD
jgi:serine protease Do